MKIDFVNGPVLGAENEHCQEEPLACGSMNRAAGPRRILLLIGGGLSLVLVVAAALLPVVPVTPFLLTAVYCFARSSDRCHSWLTTNRHFGRYVSRITEGRRLSARTKALLVALSGVTALLSVVFIAPNVPARVATLCVAAGMSAYILLQGRRRRPQAERRESTPES